MTWQQFLTEKVLGECWHDVEASDVSYCKKCGTSRAKIAMDWDRITDNRTFTTRNDLMNLFERIWRLNKWTYFIDSAICYWPVLKYKHSKDDFMAWLFCLDGEGYEPRCKMVSELYGWKGYDHD